MMPKYHIGTLDQTSKAALAGGDIAEESDPTRAVFLQSKKWSQAILLQKEKVSADSAVFTFKLGHDNQEIGLPTGQHLMIRLRDPATREVIIRAYTPLSEPTEKGKIRILVKIYYETPERKGGKMTQAIDSLPLGHPIDFKGPVGKFEYLSNGRCRISTSTRYIRRFIMICGGSGITPIFQVLRAVMKNPADTTKCLLLDGNREEQDILCRSELDAMVGAYNPNCRIIYTLSRPNETWQGRRGRMDKAFYETEVGPPQSMGSGDAMVLICGPEAMENAVKESFLEMGWSENDLFFF